MRRRKWKGMENFRARRIPCGGSRTFSPSLPLCAHCSWTKFHPELILISNKAWRCYLVDGRKDDEEDATNNVTRRWFLQYFIATINFRFHYASPPTPGGLLFWPTRCLQETQGINNILLEWTRHYAADVCLLVALNEWETQHDHQKIVTQKKKGRQWMNVKESRRRFVCFFFPGPAST